MVTDKLFTGKALGLLLAPIFAISLALYFLCASPSFHLTLQNDVQQIQRTPSALHLQATLKLLDALKRTLIKDPAKKAGFDIKKFSWKRDLFDPTVRTVKGVLQGTYDQKSISTVLTNIEVIADEFQLPDSSYNAEVATSANAWRSDVYDLFTTTQNNVNANTLHMPFGPAAPRKIQALKTINPTLPATTHKFASKAPNLRPLAASPAEHESSSTPQTDFNNNAWDNNYSDQPVDHDDSLIDDENIVNTTENYYTPGHHGTGARKNNTGSPDGSNKPATTKQDDGPVYRQLEADKNATSSKKPPSTFFLPPPDSQMTDAEKTARNDSLKDVSSFAKQTQKILLQAEKNAMLEAKRRTQNIDIFV